MSPKGDTILPIINPTPLVFEKKGALPVKKAQKELTPEDRKEFRRELKRRKKSQLKNNKKKALEFAAALNRNRPSFDLTSLIKEFDILSKKNSNYLVKLALRSIAMTNAVGYANDELQVTLNDQEIGLNNQEVEVFSRKMVRLRVLKQMGRLYKLDQHVIDAIINLQIAKDFGQIPQNSRLVQPLPLPNTSETYSNASKKEKVVKESPFTKKLSRRAPLIPFKENK